MRRRFLGDRTAADTPLPLRRQRPRRRFYVPPPMRATRRAPAPIAVQPLGAIAATQLSFLEEVLWSLLGARATVLPALEIPPSCWVAARRQYDADQLLDLVFSRMPLHALRMIGVLNADMFAQGRTFVFGYAHLRDGIGLYSLARLEETYYRRPASDPLLRGRVFRAVAHELGHTFGNPHCDVPHCVMRAVSHIESLDALAPSYCPTCLRRVRRGLVVGPSSAEGLFSRAGALLRRHMPERAAVLYREATQQAPLEPRYHNDLGVALLSLADRTRARVAFLRAAELAGQFPHPYYNLGILYREETGGAEAAEACFREGLARDPDPIAGHRYIAKLYDELFGDALRARHHYRTYIELGGSEVEVVERARALGACH